MRVELTSGPHRNPNERPRLTGRAQGGAKVRLRETASQTLIAIGCNAFVNEFESRFGAENQHFGTAPSSFTAEAPGTIIQIDRVEGKVTVRTDLVGCFPLYLRVLDDRLWVADRLSELKADNLQPDWTGAIQYLRKAFTVGSRTLFRGVRRIRPGERFEVSLASPTLNFSDESDLWAAPERVANPQVRLEEFCEALRLSCDPGRPIRLMMSGGWDSRLLLAACLSAHAADVHLYFHGDTASREANLVRRIATDLRLPLELVEIQPEMFTPERLADDFGHFESVSFPYWHHVRSLEPESPRHVMAGIFGEVAGGHYGPPTVLHGWRKLLGSLAWLAAPALITRKTGGHNGMSAALGLYRQTPYPLPWYMDRDAWHAHFAASHAAVEADIGDAMQRYERRGLRYPHEFVEAFTTEHRGAQFIAAQLHSASTDGGFSAPFAHGAPLGIAASTPFGAKAFNRLSQAAIRVMHPQLLDYPMAATLSKASQPIAIQEGSRTLRKVGESIRRRKPFRGRNGKDMSARLSWVRFGHIAATRVFHDVVDSLSLPIWDQGRMHDSLASTTPEQSHPMADMLMKIKTLDLALESD